MDKPNQPQSLMVPRFRIAEDVLASCHSLQDVIDRHDAAVAEMMDRLAAYQLAKRSGDEQAADASRGRLLEAMGIVDAWGEAVRSVLQAALFEEALRN